MVQRMTEMIGLMDVIDTTAAGTGTSNSAGIDMTLVDEVIYTLITGDIAATGTVDMEIQESQTSNFAATQSLGSITQLTDADDNKQVRVLVTNDSISDGYRYVRAQVVRATANSVITTIGEGNNAADYGPASKYNLSSVAETVII